MQHLPQFAWSYALAKEGRSNGFQSPETYIREFRNQVLDFIATNPPRFGVNWACTMDVGIRVANWLISFDLFRSFGASFDAEFETIFTRSIYEHGRHCIENLEYSPTFRSNHYLSNIAGLFFSAIYLPESKESDRWLAFALQELVSEMGHEFHPDGTNFEASTSYHRLAAEIMLYCVMFSLRLTPERRERLKSVATGDHAVSPILRPYGEQQYRLDTPDIFPDWFWERLERSVEFTRDMTAPNGDVPQIGDNDSGRFVKLWPSLKATTAFEMSAKFGNLAGYDGLPANRPYLDENILAHRHLTQIGELLFKRDDLANGRSESPETFFIRSLLGGRFVNSFRTGNELPLQQVPKNLAYPDSGLFIHRSNHLYLVIRCGSLGQLGLGGHAHNDQLSFELHLNGLPLIEDPGTYLYTPAPDLRNLFRATNVHNTVAIPNLEQHRWAVGQRGLFWLKDKSVGICTDWENRENRTFFRGNLRGYGGRRIDHIREIEIDHVHGGVIEIRDSLSGDEVSGLVCFITRQQVEKTGERSLQLGETAVEFSSSEIEIDLVSYSPKYGMVMPANRILVRFDGRHTTRFIMNSSNAQGDD